MDLHLIRMDALSVSPINVRKNPEDIDQLAASIKAVGLLSPIIVRPNGSPSTYEIIAGQRRYLAMKQIGAEHIPAIISTQPDDATSLEVSLAENFSRSELDPIQACEAFMAIKATNEALTVNDLADRFGVTPLYVSQRLKLADLPKNIRDFAKKEGIRLELLEALTIAPPAIQKAWLAAAKKQEWGWQDANAIRRQATGDKPKVGDQVFDLSEYTGSFTSDLFADASYFDDVKQFEELQAAEAEREAQKLREEGWSWVKSYISQQAVPSLHAFGKSKNKKIAGAIVAVEKQYDENHAYTGRKIVIHTGLIDPETVRQIERDKKKAAAKEAVETGSDKDAEAEGGEKPQTQILVRCHDQLARLTNAQAVLKCRDHSDILQVICDLIADQTVTFNFPRPDSDVTAIVGDIMPKHEGTAQLDKKMKPSERLMALRGLLAAAVTETDLSIPRSETPRGAWHPGEAYFQKLDKERLAVCCEEIGDTGAAERIRSGQTKRVNAVQHLTAVFEGRESYAVSPKIAKAAQSWVPKEYLEACRAREYTESE